MLEETGQAGAEIEITKSTMENMMGAGVRQLEESGVVGYREYANELSFWSAMVEALKVGGFSVKIVEDSQLKSGNPFQSL